MHGLRNLKIISSVVVYFRTQIPVALGSKPEQYRGFKYQSILAHLLCLKSSNPTSTLTAECFKPN